MKQVKFTGSPERMRDVVYDVLSKTIKLDSHDLYLTGADTTMYSKRGRYLHRLPEFKELTDFVLENCKELHDHVRIAMCWSNVYPKDSYIRIHNHITFKELTSAVFYLQGDGVLNFEDGAVDVKEGDVLFFPGVKKHWSKPNPSTTDRIIVGFDLYYGDMTDQEFATAMEEHETFLPSVDFFT